MSFDQLQCSGGFDEAFSVAAIDFLPGAALPWVAAGGLKVGLNSVNRGLELTAKTACNPVSGPAMINGSTLVVEKLAVGAVGCVGDPADREKWLVPFLKQPIEMTSNQDTLTWKSGIDIPSFESK